MNVGSHGDYKWLVTELSFEDMFEFCPELVVDKYLAVTAFDSGPLHINDVRSPSGWESRLGVMYSPKISAVEDLLTTSAAALTSGMSSKALRVSARSRTGLEHPPTTAGWRENPRFCSLLLGSGTTGLRRQAKGPGRLYKVSSCRNWLVTSRGYNRLQLERGLNSS